MSPEYVNADMLFKGDKFQVKHIVSTLIATQEPVIDGPKGKEMVIINAQEVVGRSHRNRRVVVPYGTKLLTWTENR